MNCLIVLLYGMQYQRLLESRSHLVRLPPWPRGNEKQSTRSISTFHLWYFVVCPQALWEEFSQKEDKTSCVRPLVVLALKKTNHQS